VSYILDALKKLEKERRRGMIPGLSEQDSIVYHSQKKSALPYMLISLLFLIAGVLIAWFFLVPLKSSVSPDTSTTTLKTINQDSTEITKPSPLVQPPSQTLATQPVPDVKEDDTLPKMKNDMAPNSAVKAKDDLKKTSAAPVESRQKDSQETRKASEPAQAESKREIPPEPLVRKKLYELSELPPSVRDSLQKFFTITAYMYSHTPSERMVRINDQMMREGQELEPGIRIEEIVPDGVILSYMKFRFFVSLK